MRSTPLLLSLLLAIAVPAGALVAVPDAPDLDDPPATASAAGATLAAGFGEFLVGYDEAQRDAVLLSIQVAGGRVVREHDGLHLALARTDNASRFSALVLLTPGVDFVDANDATHANGAQWNGAEWNGAQWNGAEWNGAQWNGAEWNGAEWNARNGAPSKANDPGRTLQWGLVDVKAPQAWNHASGSRSADLCVVDSGVDAGHDDLAANLWTGPDGAHGHNAMTGTSDVHDDGGHGTHMAGIAAGVVGNAWGIAGVGNTRILSAKVLDAEGKGTEADVAFGLAWCADQGAEVALLALGIDDPGPAMERAIQYAAQRDVLIVASAGNAGCEGCVGYPASDPRVLAVSATQKGRTIAPFSSTGPEVDLAAPGVDILSTFPGNRFVYGSGTSQAAAFAAGAAALVRDANPHLDAAQARAALERSARDLGAPGKDPSFGHGLLDVAAALEAA